AEDGIMGKDILMQPVIPVYDIHGYFASGKAVGLGNQTNPLRAAWAQKDNLNKNTRLLGNVFAGLEVTNRLSLKTRFGVNLNQAAYTQYNPISPENSEPSFSNSIRDSSDHRTDWTWSDAATYATTVGRHSVTALLGQEVNEHDSRFITGGMSNLLSTAPNDRYLRDVLGDASTKTVHDSAGIGRLLSFFGKLDYNFADKYYLNVTLRRDGSSAFAPDHRWGTFPAVGAAWRLSREPFLSGNSFFSNLMLRFGWGITGNQRIPAGRYAHQFGGDVGEGTLWSVNFNGSHYKNKIVSIDGVTQFFFGPISTRFGNQVINKVGEPMGAFYGFIADGFYRDSVDAAQCGDGNPAGQCWNDGARPGRIKFRDLNGDGRITAADQTIIGTPHASFAAGWGVS